MQIGELARKTGLSAHTLRYYERIGLLTYARRDSGNRRDYDDSILMWIDFIGRLKASGMPIRDMLRYAALRERGPKTEMARMELLAAHRERVREKRDALQDCLRTLDKKIAGYADRLERSGEHDIELPERKRKPQAARQAQARRDRW